MNILFVTAVLPYPLHSGGQIRTYNLLRYLSKRHTITLVSFIRSHEELSYASNLSFLKDVHMVMRGRAWRPRYITRALTGRFPFLLATYENSVMQRLLSDLIAGQSFDILHIEPFYVWPSIPKDKIPIVCSEHNIEYNVYASYVSRFSVPILKPLLYWDVAKLKFWERFVWKRADAVTAVSREDAQEIRTVMDIDPAIVPNGVDLDRFTFVRPPKRSAPVCLFVGNFRWLPNREAASKLLDTIWPEIRAAYPNALLRIVGRDMPQTIIQKAKSLGAEALTDVPDIEKEYQQADFLIAPHGIAGGTKFKMLEAMASGTVIVTTPEGVSGIAVKRDVHYLEAVLPEDYKMAIERAWSHKPLRDRMAKDAREFVEKNYSWKHIAETLETVWKQTYEEKTR